MGRSSHLGSQYHLAEQLLSLVMDDVHLAKNDANKRDNLLF